MLLDSWINNKKKKKCIKETIITKKKKYNLQKSNSINEP